MSTPARPAGPRLNLRGAVDLSGLARRPAPGPAVAPTGTPRPAGPASSGPGSSAPGSSRPGSTGPATSTPGQPAPSPAAADGQGAPQVVLDVTDEEFSSLVALSAQVPVVVDLWATWCGPCKQLSPILERLAAEYAGAFLLAKVDVDANPQIAGAFQVQSIPSVVAILKGQPVPLFQGAYPEPQVRQVLDELLRVAGANGVTGRVPGAGDATVVAEDVEPPLPPLHAEAGAALERDDLDAAADAYRRALAEAPADADAQRGLALVGMLARTRDTDPADARAALAANPSDVPAALALADHDVLAGRVDAAFTDLIALVRRTFGDERDVVRAHLLELFEVVGPDDPQVTTARRALAAALF